MQLLASQPATSEEDEDPESISLTLVPPISAHPTESSEQAELLRTEETQSPTVALFNALSNCSNLHPDPVDQGELEMQDSTLFRAGMIAPGSTSGELPPPMPGSGGWITAENMSEYFDEEGNWIGGDAEGEDESLGPGAGTVRSREEDAEPDHANGDGDDTKWRRTS